jgi:hypothetical protein
MSLNQIVFRVQDAGNRSIGVYHDEWNNAQAKFDAWQFLRNLEELGYTITPVERS